MTSEGILELHVDGIPVPFEHGDTVGVAMHRAGIRTFARSFKFHRRRGLLCLTGDCPNCLVTIDGVPLERACVVPARPGQDVRRESGFPSVERDLLAVSDRMRGLMPVGFYYKTMLRPRGLWPRVEPVFRRVAGRGTPSPAAAGGVRTYRRHVRVDVVVVGAGVAGLSAAIAAAESGASVYVCDALAVGALLLPGPELDRARSLADEARALGCELREWAAAIGVYEGQLVAVSSGGGLDLVRPARIIVATGATEELPVFPGNDLPGVWLGRGADLLAGRYGLSPGRRIVVSGEHSAERAGALAVVAGTLETIETVRAARGRRGVVSVLDGSGRRLEADALVLGTRLQARDNLARQAGDAALLAGDALTPGCSLDEAEETGRAAGRSERRAAACVALPASPRDGIVCLCEDVTANDFELAWFEGFRSTELLKRYTTATMGPCQGTFCQAHLRAFVVDRIGQDRVSSSPTTARPPERPLLVEEAAAGVSAVIEARTTLHERHLELGAEMEPLGAWSRPRTYGDPSAEYWAVRRDVSIMDVGTLGKFLVFGPDAEAFLDRFLPCGVLDLPEGRVGYTLVLNEHGYVVDDGLVCRLDGGRFYVTFTSGGGTGAEAAMRDWADVWGLAVHVLDETGARGAINLCGPRARAVLERVTEDAVSAGAFPYLHHRELTVAGVPCRVLRLGFVGELSFELHHPSASSVALWDALADAGRDLDLRPHGTEALRTLRLEKGHLIVGQDTDLDASPEKLGMLPLVRLEKPDFVGKAALVSVLENRPRRRLRAIEFPGERAPAEGSPLFAGGAFVGHLTSSRFSPVLGKGVALGWLEAPDVWPCLVEADGMQGDVVEHPFYDPEGLLVRA